MRLRFGRGRMAIIASGAALGQKVACDGNNPEKHDDSARRSSDPPPPDDAERRTLIARWTTENEIPNTSWPPRREGAEAGCRPALRRAFDACGGEQRLFAAKSGGWVAKRHHECDEITFQLAVSLLGGTLFGHSPNEPPTAEEQTEGAHLMRGLADAGSPPGASAWCARTHILGAQVAHCD